MYNCNLISSHVIKIFVDCYNKFQSNKNYTFDTSIITHITQTKEIDNYTPDFS